MRYFTRGWTHGELSDEETEDARSRYWARVDEIAPRLPAPLPELAKSVSIHDALVDHVCWEPSIDRLTLRLVCLKADPAAYEAVEIVYEGAMLGVRRIETLRQVALSRETELLYDEVDVDDEGTFAHRILFWPADEVTIDFRSMSLARWPVEDKRVHLGYPFREVVVDDDEDS
ncbi:MAG TPA: hypothetical protein VK461_15020 [Acidimicrobiales bacterium]|nr:hypothetical protein [Acidimicrobiales bacterium]